MMINQKITNISQAFTLLLEYLSYHISVSYLRAKKKTPENWTQNLSHVGAFSRHNFHLHAQIGAFFNQVCVCLNYL